MHDIVTSNKEQIKKYKENLPRHSKTDIDQVILRVVGDRIDLARTHLSSADLLLTQQNYRGAISRLYYGMYHAGRAIAFADHKGDDFQKHSVLPRHLPEKLPDRSHYSNQLNFARMLRNEADYNSYPPDNVSWRDEAIRLAVDATNFIQACEDYVILNGLI